MRQEGADDAQENEKYSFRISGVFRFFGPDGEDLTPSGQRTIAILAILLLSPGHQRSRKWIQDRLWSDRGEQQGAASLRQCVAQLRKALGKDNPLIVIERGTLALDPDVFRILPPETDHDLQLFEGLDIRDNEFEDWLRGERSRWENDRSQQDPARRDMLSALPQDKAALSAVSDLPQIDTSTGTVMSGPRSGGNDIDLSFPKLIVLREAGAMGRADDLIESGLSSTIGQILKDHSLAQVQIHENEPDPASLLAGGSGAPNLVLRTNSVSSSNLVRISMYDLQTRREIWSDIISSNTDPDTDPMARGMSNPMLKGINVASNAAADWFASKGSEENEALRNYAQGLRLTSSHTFESYLAADACFEKAFSLVPNGVYLAWRANLRSFMVVEMMPHDAKTLEAEVEWLVTRALELAPMNYLVLSLCAHVKSMVFLGFDAA